MRKFVLVLSLLSFLTCGANVPVARGSVTCAEIGVTPANTPEQNRDRLQAAIDALAPVGGAIHITPAERGYPMAGGLRLRRNVSLLGVHGPTGRGTATRSRDGSLHPTGSLFVITDTARPFLSVESATQVRGLQFWYPNQTWRDPAKIVAYPPTIRAQPHQNVEGVTLSALTFYGETFAMDFRIPAPNCCEQILFEHCYGYPLSGAFIAIDRCYDIPRILHCHVNPSNQRSFGRSFAPSVIDAVVARGTYTYWIDHTDNAQLVDVFTFGVYGGIHLGAATYGQLTNFNLDCVTVGIHKAGDNLKNRAWQVAQGSIIPNTGKSLADVHAIVVEGTGHLFLSNVECFSGGNGALTTFGACQDFLLVRGAEPVFVSLVGCRMQGYRAERPLTIENPQAHVRATQCLDAKGRFFN